MTNRTCRGFLRQHFNSLRSRTRLGRWSLCITLMAGAAALLQLPGLIGLNSAGASGFSLTFPSFTFSFPISFGPINFSPIGGSSQTIRFTSTPPSNPAVGGTYTVSAVGGASGNPVLFTIDASSTSGACSIIYSVVSFNANGTCVVDANQAGNSSYTAAPQVQQSIGVGQTATSAHKMPQTIMVWSTPPANPAVGSSYTITALGGASGNPVVITVDRSSSSVCSQAGTVTHFVTGGRCTIDINQAGNSTFAPAPQVQQQAMVKGATLTAQTITINSTPPTNPTVGGTYTVSATGGGSGNPVVLSVDKSSSGACTLSGGTLEFVAKGQCVFDLNQAGSSSYSAAPQVQQTLSVAAATVTLQAQAITFTSTPPSSATAGGTYGVSATGGESGNPVTFSIDSSSTSGACSISGSTVSYSAAGTCVIDANQAANSSYSAAPQVQQSFTIAAATPAPNPDPPANSSPPASSGGGSGPSSPTSQVCGNSSDLTGPSSAPAGAVTIPAGDDTSYSYSYDLAPNTTYWFAPGTHTLGSGPYGQMQALQGDTFIGAPGAILNGEGVNDYAFVANSGTSTGVTIEYLTIEDFVAGEGQAVVNIGGSGTGWTIENNTIENNPEGAAVDISSNTVVNENCLTGNGEYGFDGYLASGPSLGGGPTNVTLTNNEISYNGKAYYPDTSCGCSGGGKFWETGGGTVTGNYVHDNYDVGIWVDTNNYGFNISDNYIANNDGEGIQYELSYNAQIADNTLIGNGNASFSEGPAIYVSESGGDSRVPGPYSGSFNITGNVMTNNWEGVRIWENSNRFCGNDQDGDSTSICTLVVPGTFTFTTCRAHLAGSTSSGNPDYFDGCRWKAQNIDVSGNTFNLTSLSTLGSSCTTANECGENALLSNYASTPSDWSGADPYPGYTVPNNISNHQNNVFKDNVYNGPWEFEAFDGMTLTPAQWTAGLPNADSSGDAFGAQDAGSTFNS